MLCFFIISTTFGIIGLANIVKTNNDNTPPNPPEIEGPTSGIIEEIYTYYVTVTDSDFDDYLSRLEVDFGDGVIVEDCGCNRPWENGEIIIVEHSWKRVGDYDITARVSDVHNEWSEWSEPMPVTMPRNKMIQNSLISRLLQLFPILQKVLF